MSIKSNGVEITNNLTTNGVLDFDNGYLFLGNSYLKSPNTEQTYVPSQSYAGTSESRGNVSRNMYNLNSSGPVIFNETLSDAQQTILKYTDIVSTNPALTNYPWLYPPSVINDWTENTQDSFKLSNTFPIYKVLGKGLGEVKFFKTGNMQYGDESSAGTTESYEPNGLTFGTNQSSTRELIYPFNGRIYSGTLVQFITSKNEITGIKETCVIPYQNGRGIPLYSTNFCPSTKLTEFSPFGELKWPLSGNTISPSLASGTEPGDSSSCVGIVLDTYSSTNKRLFNYTPQNLLQPVDSPHDKWYNHPAPHTVSAASIKSLNPMRPDTQGFLSPGPNLSGTYYAPWPEYYAYKETEPIPVLTRGITTARIGATCNIALTSYGIKQQISATDESWVPVSCIPLFQGERLEAGSYVYASVKGQLMTSGPRNPLTRTPYGQTPWDVFVDSTWGNIGWTGTPGLSFCNIPDSTTAILEVLKTSTGTSKSIPYLNQSNQGSIIVHPITTIGPDPSIGNPITYTFYPNPADPKEKETNEQRRNLKGISGRCILPQHVPDKAQPIGIVLETIEGTGKWDYSGFSLSDYDPTVQITKGGVSYLTNPTSVDLTGGTGTGKEGTWTTFIEGYPNLGTITGTPTETVAGVGYVDGDVLTFKDDSLVYSTTQYKGNNTTVSSTGTALTLTSGGSGYTADSTLINTHNLSRNNVYFKFDISAGGELSQSATSVGSDYPQDFSIYPIGTQFRVIQGSNSSAIFEVADDMTYSSIGTLTLIDAGTGYSPAPQNNTIFETQVINTFNFNCVVSYITGGDNISTATITDYGSGNTAGDLLVVLDGDNNATIKYPGIPPGYQEIIAGCSGYPTGYTCTTTKDDGSPLGLELATLSIDSLVNDKNVPTSFSEITPDAFVGPVTISCNDGENMAYPLYISNNFRVYYDSGIITPITGGSGYTTSTENDTYNISANSLRLKFTVLNSSIVSIVAGNPISPIFDFIENRYTFDPVNGTEVRLVSYEVPPDEQTVVRLISGPTNIEVEILKNIGVYFALSDGDWIFHTQRLDQTNPTVDLVSGDTSGITSLALNTAGTNNQQNDLIIVKNKNQPTNNLIFRFNDNRPYIDLPPFAEVAGFNVDTSTSAWDKYSNIMSSAVNLLDKQVLIELRPTAPMTMENEGPDAVMKSLFMPPTQNVWREFY